MDVTIAIPTYNGADRLPLILERLRSQTAAESIRWEIIIVDNNSTDGTAAVVQQYQANWSHPYPLKYCFEPEQGAAFARQRAIREAQGELVGFLDDDNLPTAEWLAAAYEFAQTHPQAGAYGGQIYGDYEVEPPANFEKIQAFLAIRQRGPNPNLYEPERISLPPAASLVVRRQAWLEHVPQRPALSGKVRGCMVQGDDYEPLLYLHKAGWEIWYNPAMQTYHQIPHWRLERPYLTELARGCGLATCELRLIYTADAQKPWIMARTFLGNSRRAVMHVLKYRQRVKTDLIAACELEFFLGSLMSPFYYLRKNLQAKAAPSPLQTPSGSN
ncbi:MULTISPECIES: hormogonium polysaccharide biosynthesis glycosyltransferase HpsE [Trichocoleus]|uniref:Hormogonium polysaccharide biosynthesis glycosyltransferase HpsE n=1 Tax=Trichocoleus desertorum GB2-A4 TaxID=2933944 RepID=A0ABV0JBE0_9CYAN|nr:hormogonium polysaccharide biosynthesis glycosyltransferase HpsE [Trichocoleus sp. FACHB-46]MBD1860895.1 glycosyltransferase family 2 protein [Trichocoleus sp. FACHB-46]